MRISLFYYTLIILMITSCIKPFDPGIKEDASNKFVVQGSVSSVEGWQYVYISRTSNISQAVFNPINDCQVEIIDGEGNTYTLNQFEEGVYRVWMSSTDLVSYRSYMVKVITSDGQILESDFDLLPEGPDQVGEVYYEIKNIPTNDPDYTIHGVQFYTNLLADPEDSRFYRWKLVETWEYHTEYPIEYYYDGIVHQVSPPDTSQKYCWKSLLVPEVYTLSTVNLTENGLNAIPLNFIYNTSDRLKIKYSLHIEQSALSEDAYNYWDKLRINSNQDGGLYTTQPLAVKGNIKNLTNPENEVLGFFQANAISTKRIFVDPVPDFELNILSTCQVNTLRFGLIEIPVTEYPAYLFSSGGNYALATMTNECVLCSASGGSNTKPDFWP